MRKLALVVAGIMVLSAAVVADEKGAKKVPGVLNFKMKSLDGKDIDLGKYQGKVVLIVNVASECGYTPQYKGLQGLHEKYGKDGLVVLGVPSNDFGAQEPGSNTEIADFCKKNYGVSFDMLSKVVVKGDKQVPLYKYLTAEETNPKFKGAVKWNFTKFLVGRNGEISARFESDAEPDSKPVVDAIEKELKKK
jgi:glutathione peroxidase